MFGKKGADLASNVLKYGGAILVGLFIAGVFGYGPLATFSATGTSTTTTTTTTTPSSGYNAASTVVTFDNVNVLSTGTTPNEYTRLFVANENGYKDLGYFAEGATKTLAPGDKLRMYSALNSTTSGSGYYAYKKETTVPDTGAITYEGQLYQMDNNPSFWYENDKGQVNTAITAGASSTYVASFTYRAQAKRALGNPQLGDLGYSNAACLVYNSTQISQVDLLVGGASVGKADTPAIVGDNLSTGFTTKCFKMPVIQNTATWNPQISITTGSSQPLADSSINITIGDINYGLNSDTNAEIIGYEDQNNVDLGFAGTWNQIDLV